MICDGAVDCPDEEDETRILCRYFILINTNVPKVCEYIHTLSNVAYNHFMSTSYLY